MPGRLKLAITLALAGLIVGATPVLASTGSHGQTPMAGYTGKVQNRVLSDTSAGSQSSFIVELTQQADLSKAYSMKDQNARGWYVYRTLKQTAEKTQSSLKAMLDRQGVSYKVFEPTAPRLPSPRTGSGRLPRSSTPRPGTRR